ncbi:hypothetical protein [Mesorhizobium sp. M0870]|uniref:DUF6953 family protein n=1 Tax=Mesorhizobium sp. M0870 TaxID=2957016 RepID=UPI003339AE8C
MTAVKAAEFMVALITEYGELRQDDAANRLQSEFGDEYVYYNHQGNLAIKLPVLAAFKKMTPNLVWFRASRYWRRRQEADLPGRMQPY